MIKKKFRNLLETKTVNLRIRVCLNSRLKTFNYYVKQKTEYYEQKRKYQVKHWIQ